jgi:flagellar biosynthesis/type III secretory pathway protein FliH
MSNNTYFPWQLPNIGAINHERVAEQAHKKSHEQESELEQLRQQAKLDGLKAAQSEIDMKLSELELLKRVLEEPLAYIDEKLESLLLTFVLTLTKQCIEQELKLDPGLIKKTIDHCLEKLKTKPGEAVLLVSQPHADLYQNYLDTTPTNSLIIKPDNTLTGMEYVFKSSHLEIDARLEAYLNEQAQVMLHHVE